MNWDRPELAKRPANFAPLTPISYLRRAASFFGARTAVIHGARSFTYTEFYARCRRLAGARRVEEPLRGECPWHVKQQPRSGSPKRALRGVVAPLGWVTEEREVCGLKSGKELLP